MTIVLRSQLEIEKLRRSGEITADVMDALGRAISPGMTTLDLEKEALRVMEERGVRSAFKGYHGYPGYICVSVNEEIVHGIPGKRRIKDGDIVSLDVGIVKDG